MGYVPWCHVIDMRPVYWAPFTAEAVVSRFYDTGNVSVHVWNAANRPHYYTMLQKSQLETPQATGRLEVVNSCACFDSEIVYPMPLDSRLYCSLVFWPMSYNVLSTGVPYGRHFGQKIRRFLLQRCVY